MKVKKWLPYFSVVVPWMIVGIPVGLVIPIFILDIPLLNVPLYHKVIDAVVLLMVSLLLGAVFTALDVRLGHVEALRKNYLREKG